MLNISLRAEPLFFIGSYPVTNSILVAFLLLLIIGGGSFLLRRRYTIVPHGIQNALEAILEQILNLMEEVLGKREYAERYLPLVATIFIFVLFSNWLGLLPGVGSFVVRHEGEATPLLRSPSSDLNFTLALAMISVLAVNVIGAGIVGALARARKFFDFRNPIHFFVGILELVGEFAKVVSFSFRLFGNVFAGEVLLTIIGFLIPYALPLPFLLLEIFVGFIQAFIFAMLTLVFLGTAIQEEHA